MNESQPDKHPYLAARDKKLAQFAQERDLQRFEFLGAVSEGENVITLPMLRWQCRLQLEPFGITVSPPGSEMDITYQVLLLDYLTAGNPKRPERFVSFADFPLARGYLKPYQGRVIQRLTHTAGATEGTFNEAAEKAGGMHAGSNPSRFLFHFFPLFEIQATRYEADEDFPHACNILFSDNAPSILSVESLIVCAEKLVSVMQGKTPAAVG